MLDSQFGMDVILLEGFHTGAEEDSDHEREAEIKHYGLTATPILCSPASFGGRRQKKIDGKKVI